MTLETTLNQKVVGEIKMFKFPTMAMMTKIVRQAEQDKVIVEYSKMFIDLATIAMVIEDKTLPKEN